jgi:cytochrome c oxidase cbb3-type subunit 1
MSAPLLPSFGQAVSPANTKGPSQTQAEWMELDNSCRSAVLFFFSGALIWLLIGTGLALVCSWKLHQPEFLANSPWLTFGRVRPAHLNAVIYGFALQAALGTALWLLCRLCRRPVMHQRLIILAALFWNLGVTIGVVGILAGDSTGIEWLEIPGYASPILFCAYVLIAAWAVITFRFRYKRRLYVSQWYLLAALFWFPWLYSSAQILLVIKPVRGTVQAAANWWYARNLLGLWFTPIGMAAVYYFVPKVVGQPIYSNRLAVLGFWSLALFQNWSGTTHLVGGPLPAWLITVSIVASVMMLVPVVAVAINHHQTMAGHFSQLKHSATLRFVVFGGMSYTLAGLTGAGLALRSFNEVTHFTHNTVAHAHLGMYAFFTMVMFGSMYYIVPRLTQREWPSARLIHLHFWTTAAGVFLYIGPLTLGGILEGLAMYDPAIPFLKVVASILPYLKIRTLAGSIIAIGQAAFCLNFLWVLANQVGPYSVSALNNPGQVVNRSVST